MVSELPQFGVDENGDLSISRDDDGAVHVYAHPDELVTVHRENGHSGKVGAGTGMIC